MYKKITSLLKPLLRSLFAIALVATLVFGQAGDALAAGGGRIGGGSFRMPSRSYSAPRTYAPSGGGGYYPGGGFGFPFVFPMFWGIGGGGGLFTILIFITVASFLVQSFRRARGEEGLGYEAASPTISVAKLQVGLLASARELQADLNTLALKANTGSSVGLAQVLQESTLALLRHPEYWVYGGSSSQETRLASAEAEFNRLVLTERSKFSGETLSNVNNQLKQSEGASSSLATASKGGALAAEAPGEYIVVTLLVGAQGSIKLPKVNSSEEMRQALQQLGGLSSDRLLALEVLWTPQAEGDVLTSEDLLVEYPTLKLI